MIGEGERGPIYDRIGEGYDTTRRADRFIVGRLASLLEIMPQGRYVDIACGTGNYTTALAARGGRWSGVDQSRTMIEGGALKSKDITWTHASVEALPFPDNTFDGAVCTLAIHHFASLEPAFGEVRRVLDARGRFVLFTATAEQMRGYWLNEYFPEAMRRSIEQMPPLAAITGALSSAGLVGTEMDPYAVRADLEDWFLYSGKDRPELYLDPRVRHGASTFAALADAKEVDEGCARLSADIASGRVRNVMARYRNDGGDYLFIAARPRP